MRTTATFRLHGSPTLSAAAVTLALEVTPSRSFEAGEPLSPQSQGKRGAVGEGEGGAAGVGVEFDVPVEFADHVMMPLTQGIRLSMRT